MPDRNEKKGQLFNLRIALFKKTEPIVVCGKTKEECNAIFLDAIHNGYKYPSGTQVEYWPPSSISGMVAIPSDK